MKQLNGINFDTDNLIIVLYPRFAGGKFVGNCLSLSYYALSQNPSVVNLFLSIDQNNKHGKKLRLQNALNSLPPKHRMKFWGIYEYGCIQFFGNYITDYNTDLNNFHDWIPAVTNSGKNFFVMSHNLKRLEQYLSTWKNASILYLENVDAFCKVANRLKNNDDSYYKSIERPSCALETVDMSKIFVFKEWSHEIQRLYNVYGFDDFDEEILYTFWKAYMDLHK